MSATLDAEMEGQWLRLFVVVGQCIKQVRDRPQAAALWRIAHKGPERPPRQEKGPGWTRGWSATSTHTRPLLLAVVVSTLQKAALHHQELLIVSGKGVARLCPALWQ